MVPGDAEVVRVLRDVFGRVDAKAKHHVRLAARSVLLKDFDQDFPNPNPPRNPKPVRNQNEAVAASDSYDSSSGRKY